MNSSPGRLTEPALPYPACRLRADGRKGGFAAAGDRMLHVLSVASRALAAFALRGGPDFAREVRGRKIMRGRSHRDRKDK